MMALIQENVIIFSLLIGLLAGYLLVRVTHWRILRQRRRMSDKQLWRLHPYYGGAPINIHVGNETEAIDYCARTYGVVMHIDQEHRFIFYKPFGVAPTRGSP